MIVVCVNHVIWRSKLIIQNKLTKGDVLFPGVKARFWGLPETSENNTVVDTKTICFQLSSANLRMFWLGNFKITIFNAFDCILLHVSKSLLMRGRRHEDTGSSGNKMIGVNIHCIQERCKWSRTKSVYDSTMKINWGLIISPFVSNVNGCN